MFRKRTSSWNLAADTEAYDYKSARYIKTRGITYRLPTGTPYGFYIKVGHNGKPLTEALTEAEINEKKHIYDYICFSHSYRNSHYITKDGTYDAGEHGIKDLNFRIRNYPYQR